MDAVTSTKTLVSLNLERKRETSPSLRREDRACVYKYIYTYIYIHIHIIYIVDDLIKRAGH